MSFLRSSSVGVMRPPKPPCWRDFVVSSAKETVDALHDHPGRLLGAKSPVRDLIEPSPGSRPAANTAAPGSRQGRVARRPRAKIHRTRSEHVILPEDLPDAGGPNPLPGSSAAPEELAPPLRPRPRALTPDGQFYTEENNKRCQSWLASIEAAEPLDEVDYNTDHEGTLLSNDLNLDYSARRDSDNASDFPFEVGISNVSERNINILTDSDLSIDPEQQATIEMEIPEETFHWDEDTFLRSSDHRETQPRMILGSNTCQACKKPTKTVTTNITASSNSRKFPAPPLCGACTDCISCGSGERLSSAASDINIRTERAITVEDNSNLCSCGESPSQLKASNKRSKLRKSQSSKSQGLGPPAKDRSTSSPAVPRNSGRLMHRGGGAAGSGNVTGELVPRPGPWQQISALSSGASRRARSVSRRRASHTNVFQDKDCHL